MVMPKTLTEKFKLNIAFPQVCRRPASCAVGRGLKGGWFSNYQQKGNSIAVLIFEAKIFLDATSDLTGSGHCRGSSRGNIRAAKWVKRVVAEARVERIESKS